MSAQTSYPNPPSAIVSPHFLAPYPVDLTIVLTVHNRWVVYRGDSSDSKDIIFSAKQSSLIQFKTSLDVFLGSNEKESVCDYKVKGSWFDRSCTIYAGESTNIVAQMHKKHTVQSIALGKDTFAVTVYPNVDYAFIVALVVIWPDPGYGRCIRGR
ncbi:hypothetical protein CTI12_AA470430 [Artemisia annua]|uniref:Tubby C-terminal-like domain-containing protein n=1 Tax=Artemisia annua TaxID=35608 RepID=A0A2U1LNY0_ARTAN|nr:hypothetical protein CTI12_AA470430 [Artemisia annua]